MTNAFWGVGYAESAYPRLLAEGLRRQGVGGRGWQWKSYQTIPFRHGQQRGPHGGASQGRRNVMPECSSPLRAPQCGQNKPCREGRRGPSCDPLSHSDQSLDRLCRQRHKRIYVLLAFMRGWRAESSKRCGGRISVHHITVQSERRKDIREGLSRQRVFRLASGSREAHCASIRALRSRSTSA